VASQGSGVIELAAAIREYEAYLRKENLAVTRKVENWQNRLLEMLRDALLERAQEQLGNGAMAATRQSRDTNEILTRSSKRL
jgi:putative protein kinase ArgK-like GTPase of G3E family